jgi:hypothetical protein
MRENFSPAAPPTLVGPNFDKEMNDDSGAFSGRESIQEQPSMTSNPWGHHLPYRYIMQLKVPFLLYHFVSCNTIFCRMPLPYGYPVQAGYQTEMTHFFMPHSGYPEPPYMRFP